MCVVYVATEGDKKDLEIKQVIETLEYDLHHKQAHINLAFFVSNHSEKAQSIRMVHRKTVDDVRPLDWNRQSDYNLIELLCNIYSDRLSFDLKNRTVEFFRKPREFAKEEDHLKAIIYSQELPFRIEDPTEGKASYRIFENEKERAPYTSIKIDNFPARKTVFYSINMVVKNYSYDYLIGSVDTPSIDGAAVLLRKIKYRDLSYLSAESPWNSFFETNINNQEKIIKPESYGTLIRNKRGTLPECYRLDPNVYREFIKDTRLASKVAWFTSTDPDQDFTIEALFSNHDDKIRRKGSREPVPLRIS